MTSFIHDVLVDLQKKNVQFSQLIFVLPSKRAGLILRDTLSKLTEKTIFAPDILSIEEFVEGISDLTYASNSELLFQFYDSYLKHTPKKSIEPFDTFSKWAQLLIQDFNEIDRYLIEPTQVFEYLSAIKEIDHKHWSIDESPTNYIKNYLLFWKRLQLYYTELNVKLRQSKLGYQGMVYKTAVKKIDTYIKVNPKKKHVFIGFNALNTAEDQIIQSLLKLDLAFIYWDIDQHFIKNPVHSAGLFIRKYKKTWKHFDRRSFNWLSSYYSQEKYIEIIGVPKNIGQIKYIGELLLRLNNKGTDFKKTAIVLGDERLLLPLLNSLPTSIDRVNVTMGLPLKLTPIASLFEDLFKIQKANVDLRYFKDIISILKHPTLQPLFYINGHNTADDIIAHIKTNNITYLTVEDIIKISQENKSLVTLLFSSWDDNPLRAVNNSLRLIIQLKALFDHDKLTNALNLEYLYKFHLIFNELLQLMEKFDHVKTVQILYGLFRELLKNETLDFKGEPLEGLQIMGMLETRVLDFETIIMVSVNEGILPAGKTQNSFIPFDVKIENQLPTYKEKDAVYTYHFYRLMQRTKNAYILYNTEPDVLNGGEKSRFISQLIIEKKHHINHFLVSPKVPSIKTNLKHIKKSTEVLKKLDKLANNGFSPSSLTNYIRNPIDFYLEKVLDISAFEDVEEHIALNTLGTVIHNTLEDFYKPIVGKILLSSHLEKMKTSIDQKVRFHFKKEFKEGDISKGKNLIIYEIAKRYISNFITLENADLKAGNTIKIIAIEANSQIPIFVEGLDKTVQLKGKVDRVDVYNGITRIIDYKTGRVEQRQVEVVDWDEILTDYDKYSKSFQVLMYVYMLYKSGDIKLPVEAGIISFKSLNSGFIRFATKPSSGSRKRDHNITNNTLLAFETQLKILIREIYNPEINFIEKPLP